MSYSRRNHCKRKNVEHLFFTSKWISPIDRKTYHYLICTECYHIEAREGFFISMKRWREIPDRRKAELVLKMCADGLIPGEHVKQS